MWQELRSPIRRGTGGPRFGPRLPRSFSPCRIGVRWRDFRKAETTGRPEDDGRIAVRWRPGEPA
jgi:hypothetical protein